MTMYDKLQAVYVEPEETSYWSPVESHLDPNLFQPETEQIKADVRRRLLGALYAFWRSRWSNAEGWSTVWVAGSGVSFHWSAARNPGDLDVLVGIDFYKFRQSNPDVWGLSDDEIAQVVNRQLVNELWPVTANFHAGTDTYEATYYVNAHGTDIYDIHPYAAYNLTRDGWDVYPSKESVPYSLAGEKQIEQDAKRAQKILQRYDTAVTSGQLSPSSTNDTTIRSSVYDAYQLFNDIHDGRKKAYDGGVGLNDPAEYRYKGAKRTGVLKALRSLAKVYEDAQNADETQKYGAPILSAHDALIKAAIGRRWVG
jgi:hypothetical protein